MVENTTTPNRQEVQNPTSPVISPYFASAKTPSRRPRLCSDAETEPERAEIPRKRRRPTFRGVTPDELLSPPSSPEELSRALRTIKPSLIQEYVCEDPWKTIVATTLLNKTSGKVAVPIFWELIERWPTPIALAQAATPSLTELLRPLGRQSMRTSRLIRLSHAYVMHPPALSPHPRSGSGCEVEHGRSQDVPMDNGPAAQFSFSSSGKHTGNSVIFDENRGIRYPRGSSKEYRGTQRTSPIAHLPFTGPYAIDSFRIFGPALNGGGAGARVEEQLGRVACLAMSEQRSGSRDDFDETPDWYDPCYLYATGDEDAEWRKVRPDDKQLRRYLVWRWAIEGVEYDPERQTLRPADWPYLNRLIRQS